MKPLKLVLKELLYRKISSAVILLTAITAACVSVGIYTLSKASENETRKIMREQGLNLYIFPKGTDLIDFYSAVNMPVFPESYVDSLAKSKTFDAVRHLTGILQVKYPEWIDPNGSVHQIMLFGYKDEATQIYLPKQETMGFDVRKGTVVLGSLTGKNIKPGEPFTIKGADGKTYTFKVSGRLPEGKGMLDQGVSFHLEDLQQILGMPGKINKIEALGCVCHDGRINNSRAQVQAIFPDLEVTELSSIADARENQRLMMNKYGSLIIPFVVISALLVTGLLFYQNTTTRKQETGLLKTLGYSNSKILYIILLKAFILGLIGGIAGYFLGSLAAVYFGKEVFRFTAMSLKPIGTLLYYCMVIFPLLWMLAGWIPALIAANTDAARTLSGE